MEYINITEMPGIRIGHEQNLAAATGCTVIICENGAAGGVDVRGGSPGTRETDLLNPINLVDKLHAVLLSGGSAFGLDAASGVMQYLEEKGVGFDVGFTRVPIVAGAVLFDLGCGDYRVRPDKEMGYRACANSERNENLEGNVGAGAGATVGKILGPGHAMKGGLGTCCIRVGSLMVGAIVAVNCLGDVVNPKDSSIIAGALMNDKKTFLDTEKFMIGQCNDEAGHIASQIVPNQIKKNLWKGNTTIGTIVTNAIFDKAKCNKVASMAHNGYARSIRPSHTMYDGDTIFTMATGEVEADVNVVGLLAARVMEQAVVRGVKAASSIHGYPCSSDIIQEP